MSETIDCRGQEQPTIEARLLQETENTCPYCVDVRITGDIFFSAMEVLGCNDKALANVIVHVGDDGLAVITIYDAEGEPQAKYTVPKVAPGFTGS